MNENGIKNYALEFYQAWVAPQLCYCTETLVIAGDAYGETLWRDYRLQKNKIIEK